jgi:FKBP-type peptidyl-prolyl cis-trans isomerase FklB
MKQKLIPVLGACVLAATTLWAEEKIDLKDNQQRISYSLGANIGSDLKRQGLDLNADALARGISDALKGTLSITEAEVRQTLADARGEMMAQVEAKQRAAAGDNLEKGKSFLVANGKKEGVKQTASGLQYKVLKDGNGPMPKASDEVEVHYHGTLIDGTVFDSSVDRGEPVKFPVTGVIPGWVEALQLMKVGSKWQLYVPSELAYGERSPGGNIGPNSVLVFDVELLGIK